MPEVRAITPFYDMAVNKARQAGETWTCDAERAESLKAYGFVEAVAKKKPAAKAEEPAVEEPTEAAEEPKPAPKKRTSKKKAE